MLAKELLNGQPGPQRWHCTDACTSDTGACTVLESGGTSCASVPKTSTSGSLYRNKLKYAAFKRKHMLLDSLVLDAEVTA